MSMFIAGLSGVIVGGLLVGLAVYFYMRMLDQKEKRNRVMSHKVREIETLIALNQKVVEILEKRILLMDKYVSFDAFDDCYITVDDYVYLQSYAAHNSFYLPNHFLEEFFKQISMRRAVLSPEETIAIGGYTFRGGRVIMEQLSDNITEMIYERKVQLNKLTKEPMSLFSKTF